MLAVIQTGGKQYIVKPGETIKVEKLETEVGQEVLVTTLLVAEEDGSNVALGKPEAAGHAVTTKVKSHGRHDKVTIIKFKNKVRYKRKNGHRQPFTELEVTSIK